MQADLDRLLRRLRHLPPGAWPAYRATVRQVLVDLASLGDAVEPREVPHLPDHALADALAVIGGDAVRAAECTADPRHRAAVIDALRRGLSATR